MADKATHEALEAAGFDRRYSDARQFREQVQREFKQNARIIEAAKIQAN